MVIGTASRRYIIKVNVTLERHHFYRGADIINFNEMPLVRVSKGHPFCYLFSIQVDVESVISSDKKFGAI
jgi:hypothetical protein